MGGTWVLAVLFGANIQMSAPVWFKSEQECMAAGARMDEQFERVASPSSAAERAATGSFRFTCIRGVVD